MTNTHLHVHKGGNDPPDVCEFSTDESATDDWSESEQNPADNTQGDITSWAQNIRKNIEYPIKSSKRHFKYDLVSSSITKEPDNPKFSQQKFKDLDFLSELGELTVEVRCNQNGNFQEKNFFQKFMNEAPNEVKLSVLNTINISERASKMELFNPFQLSMEEIQSMMKREVWETKSRMEKRCKKVLEDKETMEKRFNELARQQKLEGTDEHPGYESESSFFPYRLKSLENKFKKIAHITRL